MGKLNTAVLLSASILFLVAAALVLSAEWYLTCTAPDGTRLEGFDCFEYHEGVYLTLGCAGSFCAGLLFGYWAAHWSALIGVVVAGCVSALGFMADSLGLGIEGFVDGMEMAALAVLGMVMGLIGAAVGLVMSRRSGRWRRLAATETQSAA